MIEGCIQRIDRTGLDFVALEDPKLVPPQTTYWHVFAAIGEFCFYDIQENQFIKLAVYFVVSLSAD